MAEEVREPTQADVQLTATRYELFKWLIPVVWIVALWIPLRAALPIAKALAGKHTDIAVTFSLSITVSLVLGGTVYALLRRNREQRAEVIRLRRRCARLETSQASPTN
ncbi:MAG: hypothetical protein ACHQHO_08320 [Solirubrobacterales bacterium]